MGTYGSRIGRHPEGEVRSFKHGAAFIAVARTDGRLCAFDGRIVLVGEEPRRPHHRDRSSGGAG